MKKVLFVTGTRADYGKIKSLMSKIVESPNLELYIFATGMHTLSIYGNTWREIEKDGFSNIYQFINQQNNTKMDVALSNTILGLSNYVQEYKPDMIVVHGDRLEALAGAIVGAFNNLRVAHIEGGEISGTIDESIRHSITKFAHMHFVSNQEAKKRIMQLGEPEERIYVVGSPDIDVMLSNQIPTIEEAKKKYDIEFEKFSILMFHPVTTEVDLLEVQIKALVDAVLDTNDNFIVIFPNNDEGSKIILKAYERFKETSRIKLYPSIKFEYFLTLLKHCDYLIGNSSAGIRETCVYGIPTLDIGNRQMGRYSADILKNIIPVDAEYTSILNGINQISDKNREIYSIYGDGDSALRFVEILEQDEIWNINISKNFVDL